MLFGVMNPSQVEYSLEFNNKFVKLRVTDASQGLLITRIKIPQQAWYLLNHLRQHFICTHMDKAISEDDQLTQSRVKIVGQAAGLGPRYPTSFVCTRLLDHTFEWEKDEQQPQDQLLAPPLKQLYETVKRLETVIETPEEPLFDLTSISDLFIFDEPTQPADKELGYTLHFVKLCIKDDSLFHL